MSDADILTTIDRFIRQRFFHYALMINGKWGCGKTFFVENKLVPHIRQNLCMDVNYISLYGVNNTDAITATLCTQAIKDKFYRTTGKKIGEKAGTITSIAGSFIYKNVLSKFNIEDADGIEKILDILPNYDNNVIIFDDLERCGLDINEVLGYINNFIEHSDAAVIIVANEDEIGKWQLQLRQCMTRTVRSMFGRINGFCTSLWEFQTVTKMLSAVRLGIFLITSEIHL